MAENQQSDDSIGDMINAWRQESKKKFKLDRIKRMVFDSKMNKKPSEYQPEDYIPRIPEALKAKYSQNISSSSSTNNDTTLENIPPTAKKRKGEENHNVLGTPSNPNLSKRSRIIATDKENISIAHDKSINRSSRSRRVLGESNINIVIENVEKTPEKASRFRSVSPLDHSSHEQSQLGPLRTGRMKNTSIRGHRNYSGSSSEIDSMIAASAGKKRSHHKSLEHISRMINDSKQNKKPSEYDPEDFIPKSAQIAIRESALKASLKEASERKAEMERELAELKAAAAVAEKEKQNETRLSRKTAHNKSANIKKTSKAKKNLEMVSDQSLSNDEEQAISKSMRSRNHIADTSEDSSPERAQPADDSANKDCFVRLEDLKAKSFNKTKEIIRDTQPTTKNNATFDKSRRRTRVEDSSQESEEPLRRSIRVNQTTSLIKDTQSQEIGQKSFKKSNRIQDSSQESLKDSQRFIKVKNLPTPPSDSDPPSTINMIDQMRNNNLPAAKNKHPKHLVNALPITPILTTRQSNQHEAAKTANKGLEYSYVDESLIAEGTEVNDRKTRKSDKYKMSSTANNSKLLQFTFNQNMSEYDTEEVSKKIKNKHDRKSQLMKQVPSDSPAKKAFETSLRRKSEVADLQPQDVEQMNKAPLDLENDEIIIGSGQLFEELEAQSQQKQMLKPALKSRIEITKIPVKSTPILLEEVTPVVAATVAKQAKNLTRASGGFKVAKNQSIVDENDDMELAATQSNMFIKRSFTKSINSTTRSINQTTHNNTTRTQSKSAVVTGSRTSNFLIPAPPIHHPRIVSPPRSAKASIMPAVEEPSPKQQTTPPLLEGRDQLVYDETVASMFSDHEDVPNPPPVLPQVMEEDEEVDTAPAKTGKALLMSGKPKQVSKPSQSKKQQKQPLSGSEYEEEEPGKRRGKSPKKKETKKRPEVFENENVSAPEEIPDRPSRISKKKEVIGKENKKAQMDKKVVKKGLSQRDPNQAGTSEVLHKKSQVNSLDKRRRTLYEINAVEEEEENSGVRKSKRVKIDKFSDPVYEYEEVEDFNGNIIRVQHLVAVTKKDYSSKYAQYMIDFECRKKGGKAIQKKKVQKKKKLILEESPESRSDHLSVQDVVQSHEDNASTIHIQMNSQENTLSLSGWDQSRVNQTSESIIIEEEGNGLGDNTELTKTKVFSFTNQLESKNFEECYPGVSIIVISTTDGLMCIDPQCSTKTQSHVIQANYVMQKGGRVAFSLNGNVSKHRAGDVIKIPANLQYKFKNVSHTEKAYFHFQFF